MKSAVYMFHLFPSLTTLGLKNQSYHGEDMGNGN